MTSFPTALTTSSIVTKSTAKKLIEMSEEDSIQIDSKHDILFAEQILKMRNKK